MTRPSNVLRCLNHSVVSKPLWKQDLAFLSHVNVSANRMLVHAVTGADAFFGSHADGRIQKASTGCFPVLANILGQESCLSNPSYSTCKPEILFTMLMRMGEDFSCPGNRLGIIVFLCPCKICSADGVERKSPYKSSTWSLLLSVHTSQWQMTSLQMQAHGERRQQQKHQGNLEAVRETFLLLVALSKSPRKHGVSCFNPQRFPAPCYWLGLLVSHPQAGRTTTRAAALV